MIIIGSNEEAKTLTNFIINTIMRLITSRDYLSDLVTRDLKCKVTKWFLGELYHLPEIAARTEIDDVVITDETIGKDLLLNILDYCVCSG